MNFKTVTTLSSWIQAQDAAEIDPRRSREDPLTGGPPASATSGCSSGQTDLEKLVAAPRPPAPSADGAGGHPSVPEDITRTALCADDMILFPISPL
jgi:hypothetical protein